MNFDAYNIFSTVDYESKFEKYIDLLISYNRKFNLTSVTSREDVKNIHFLDSALLLANNSYGSDGSSKRVLDVGTGAGFPGMVLAILRPEWNIVLLDSLNKRVGFLNLVASELELDNITVLHGRAEDLARDDNYREGFDLVLSRAVAELRLLLELTIPFVKREGEFVAYKGPKADEELGSAENALNELACKLTQKRKFIINDKERILLHFSRVEELNDRYPRRAGIPAKRPL